MKIPNFSRSRVEQKLAHELRQWRSKVATARENGALPWQNLPEASFMTWVNLTNGRYRGDFPVKWRSFDLPFTSNCRVGVAVHVFYPDLVDELAQSIQNIPVPCDVYVTNSSGAELNPDIFQVGNVENVAILPIENRGRDIWPLAAVVNAGYLDQYELILKIHTKKSQWRAEHATLDGTGDQWREDSLRNLLGSPQDVQQILDGFAADPSLGAVGPNGTHLGPEYWGGDYELVTELAKRLGLQFKKDSLDFIAGSIYWVRGFVLQGLRSLCLSPDCFEDEAGQIDGTTAHAVERLIGLLTVEAGLTNREVGQLFGSCEDTDEDRGWHRFLPTTELVPAARYIPFYLPQFHPSDVNDQNWGAGFTEWNNVTRARPAFPGHVQPLLPGELGFYDLRNDEIRTRQLELEQYAGIEGFMYYYYWFSGKRVLNVPIERLAADKELAQPFCLMWANENWTRTWDGQEENVILGQRYDEVPAEDFIEDVIEFLLDPRYLRVDDKAVLAVYRPALIGDFASVARVWRKRAADAGVGELLLLSVDVTKDFGGFEGNLSKHGLDGHLGFPPHGVVWPRTKRSEVVPSHRFTGHLVSYPRMAAAAVDQAVALDPDGFPGVMVSFDNTARKSWNADVWYGSNPYTFRRWLADVTQTMMVRTREERLVFINAWNEWAESAVLEPTERWGKTYLQAVRSVAFS